MTYADLLDRILTADLPDHPDDRVRETRRTHRRAYAPWSAQEDECLTRMIQANVPVEQMAVLLHRNDGAVRSRVSRLEGETAQVTMATRSAGSRTDGVPTVSLTQRIDHLAHSDVTLRWHSVGHAAVRRHRPRSGQPWRPEEDALLREQHAAGLNADALAREFRRQYKELLERLTELGLDPRATTREEWQQIKRERRQLRAERRPTGPDDQFRVSAIRDVPVPPPPAPPSAACRLDLTINPDSTFASGVLIWPSTATTQSTIQVLLLAVDQAGRPACVLVPSSESGMFVLTSTPHAVLFQLAPGGTQWFFTVLEATAGTILAHLSVPAGAPTALLPDPPSQHREVVLPEAASSVDVATVTRPPSLSAVWQTPTGAPPPPERIYPFLNAVIAQRDISERDLDDVRARHGLKRSDLNAFKQYIGELSLAAQPVVLQDTTTLPARFLWRPRQAE